MDGNRTVRTKRPSLTFLESPTTIKKEDVKPPHKTLLLYYNLKFVSSKNYEYRSFSDMQKIVLKRYLL